MKILKFGAVWCPGCLVMRPRFQQIEASFPELETEYFEYDMHPELIAAWDIGKILPVFIFVNNQGEEITRLIGEQSKQKIIDLINQYIKE